MSTPLRLSNLRIVVLALCFVTPVVQAQEVSQSSTKGRDVQNGRTRDGDARALDAQEVDRWSDFLSRARVVGVLPSQSEPLVVSKPRANLGDLDFADLQDSIPQDMPMVIYELPDDATVMRGGSVAAEKPYTVTVYSEPRDEGLGFFGLLQMSDHGGGANPGNNWHGHWIRMANWAPGGLVTSYGLRVFNSSANSGTGVFRTSLWDGDPLGFFDTVCSVGGIAAPIANTTVVFSGIPQGTLVDLVASVSEAQVNCATTWMVLEPLEGCRPAWRIGGPAADDQPAIVGTPLGFLLPFSSADTTPPLRCCRTNAACTVATALADCGHASMCSDRIVETLFGGFTDETITPPYYAGFVASVRAATDLAIYGVPVSADQPPHEVPVPNGWSIEGDTIVLTGGDRPVWIDWMVTDWDPDESGNYPSGWAIYLDTVSLSSGTVGTLDYFTPSCSTDDDCDQAVGPGTLCIPGNCQSIFLEDSREDYVYRGAYNLAGVDQEQSGEGVVRWSAALYEPPEITPNYKCIGGFVQGRLCGPSLCPDPDAPCAAGCPGIPQFGIPDGFCRVNHDDRYLGTLSLYAPEEARGTFTIGLLLPGYTRLYDAVEQQYFPLLAIAPARITILDCPSVTAPLMDQPPVLKNRYLSFTPTNPGVSTALRVTFEDLPGAYAALNDAQMWVGPPARYCHNSGQAKEPPGGCGPAPGLPSRFFYGATLQCQPFYMDWHGTCPAGVCVGGLREGSACAVDDDCAETIHVFHENIVPAGGLPGSAGSLDLALYHVQAIVPSCSTAAEGHFSAPLIRATSKWGDTVGDCSSLPCSSPDGVVNVSSDVIALLDRFKNQPTGASKPRADLVGQSGPAGRPDVITTIIDVTKGLDAFRGVAYPEPPGPRPCE